MNDEQIAAANKLRAERPDVLHGTNVILDPTKRSAWYAQVTAAAKEVKVEGHERSLFFDLAGVPD